MNCSPADEYDRRQGARDADRRRRIAAVVWDPNGPEIQIASEVVGRQLEAEAIVADADLAARYATMSAECDARIAARRLQEGWAPLNSITIIGDDEEVAAVPSRPTRPTREPLATEVERRLATYQGTRGLFSVADIERQILLERIEADLVAGLIDDEECPF